MLTCCLGDVTVYEELKIYTPVNADKLAEQLKGYSAAQFIIDGFKNGFSLGVGLEPTLRPCTKLYPAKPELRTKIVDEVEKGRIVGPFHKPPVDNLMISPICVIPKPNSHKVRMIFNLSQPQGMSVNDNIDEIKINVKYCSVSDVVQWLMNEKTCRWWMSKVDLTDAYRMVPIRKDDWKFLGMRVGNDVFIDRCLPMGAASSCQTFQKISDALAWMVMATCPVTCTIFNYLDDFLILARDDVSCGKALKHFEMLCEEVGVPISREKTVRPTQHIIFLGIGINSDKLMLYVPEEKARKTLVQLRSFMGKSKPRVSEWQSILGKLCHLAQVVFAGRPYLSSLYGSLAGILSKHKDKRQRIFIEAREDLQVWESFLAGLTPNKTFRMFEKVSVMPPIYTDASTTIGYGAVFGSIWFAGVWPDDHWRSLNICFLELYPIYVAIFMWSRQLSDSTVEVHTDNQALVSIINRLYTKDTLIRCLLKPLAVLCLDYNIHIVAHHIPGKENVGPDMLSRGQVTQFIRQFPGMKRCAAFVPAEVMPENLSIPDVGNKKMKRRRKRKTT